MPGSLTMMRMVRDSAFRSKDGISGSRVGISIFWTVERRLRGEKGLQAHVSESPTSKLRLREIMGLKEDVLNVGESADPVGPRPCRDTIASISIEKLGSWEFCTSLAGRRI
eukprot:3458586-Amphidinium_carterae.4